jgi:AcrR family transcriptional regulator
MTLVTETGPDWRQRKKTATSDRIRACALRLFREQGYDATTVEQIAAAAGVSHMTFCRYFPTKEDVALSDSYDPLIASFIAQTPAAWPLIQRIRAALVQGLRQVYDTDRDTLLAQNKLIASTPALRERLLGRPDRHPAGHPPGPRSRPARPARQLPGQGHRGGLPGRGKHRRADLGRERRHPRTARPHQPGLRNPHQLPKRT